MFESQGPGVSRIEHVRQLCVNILGLAQPIGFFVVELVQALSSLRLNMSTHIFLNLF